jgi:hypothetical protein
MMLQLVLPHPQPSLLVGCHHGRLLNRALQMMHRLLQQPVFVARFGEVNQRAVVFGVELVGEAGAFDELGVHLGVRRAVEVGAQQRQRDRPAAQRRQRKRHDLRERPLRRGECQQQRDG